MMYPSDALLLAVTKLKTRKIRLGITVVVAGLMFVLLATVSFVVNGGIQTVERFSQEGLGKRFIVKADDASYGFTTNQLSTDKDIIAVAKQRFDALKKDKVAESKRLGLSYDPSSEMSPVYPADPNYGMNQESVDIFSPLIADVYDQKTVELSKNFYESFDKALEKSDGFIGKYNSLNINAVQGPKAGEMTKLIPVLNGKEIELDGTEVENFNPTFRGVGTLISQGISFMSDDILSSFALNREIKPDDSTVQIIAPYSAVEEIIGLAPLSDSASSEEKLERLKTVREKSNNYTFDVCLRNAYSQQLVADAVAQQSQIAREKSLKDYKTPDYISEPSTTACAVPIITRDVRTAEQKKLDENQKIFDEKFGTNKTPAQRIIKMKIIGITPDPPNITSFSDVGGILSAILTPFVGEGWLVPLSEGSKLTEFSKQLSSVGTKIDYGSGLYAEFESAELATKFINENNCVIEYSNDSFIDPSTVCVEQGKPYFISSFGSSSIAIEQFKKGFNRVFQIALIVCAVISSIIMMGTVGKIISDSRRETAVFRAIGAKRFDIAQIYLSYVLLVGGLVTIFSLGLGALLAQFVSNRYSGEATVDALVNFNALDLTKEVSLIYLNKGQILFLVTIIILGSIVSAALPLLANLRRNPIKDMRDER